MNVHHEQLLEALEENRDVLTIVEGKNDKRALERLGFQKVMTLNKPLFKVVEEIDDDEVIILTDLDRHGRELYHYFFRECTRRGIKVNNRVRQLLHFSELRQIEGLSRYLERVEG
jgi:5S rRNA maturation endonuclease (ribonuclease M5)